MNKPEYSSEAPMAAPAETSRKRFIDQEGGRD
jgi:hypothetical protein